MTNQFEPKFLATAIGSVPYSDPAAAVEIGRAHV